MKPKKNYWIQTFSGKQFFPFDVTPDQIDIIDIAHALSNICRFNGHCTEFYSVAEHSYRASVLIGDSTVSEKPLWGLLHDAAEAYLCDLPRPVKMCILEYKQIEEEILNAIIIKFGLTLPMPKEVKEIDDILLATERRDIMNPCKEEWTLAAKPMKQIIIPYSQKEAKRLFLERFNYLNLVC